MSLRLRLRRWQRRNGRLWIHLLLLVPTLGIGNILYHSYRRQLRKHGPQIILP